MHWIKDFKKAAHLDKFVHHRLLSVCHVGFYTELKPRVFMFDFRNYENESDGTNVEGWRDLSLDIHEEFLQIRLGSHTKHRSKHWSEGVVTMAIQDVCFIVVSNERSFHLR